MGDALTPPGWAGRTNWAEAFARFAQPKMALMLVLGFSAGLPFLLYFSTLSVRLEKADVDTALIGFFSWFGLSYSLKFLWAPIVDKLRPPLLAEAFGQRAAWIFIAQVCVGFSLIGLGGADPVTSLGAVALFSFLTAFSSATQDICIDAWRIEAASGDDEQAPLAAAYQYGYRTAMIVSGGAALTVAGFANWTLAYWAMAVLMMVAAAVLLLWRRGDRGVTIPRAVLAVGSGVAMAAVLFVVMGLVAIVVSRAVSGLAGFLDVTPSRRDIALFASALALLPFVLAAVLTPWIRALPDGHARLTSAVTGPVFDFFRRYGWTALVLLAFAASYRMSDIVMGVMAKPSYSHIGYDEAAIGLVSGLYGPWPVFVGVALAGLATLRFGLTVTLVAGAIISVIGNLTFVWLMGQSGQSTTPLFIAVTADNVAGGFAGTVFVAFLSTLTNRAFSASQYALFSSMYSLIPKLLAGSSGVIVEATGYAVFFMYAAGLGIPAIFLSMLVVRAAASDGGARAL